jgi:uncharacterized protein YkwD
MKRASICSPILGGTALALGAILFAPAARAQAIVPQRLPEPVAIHRAAGPIAQSSAPAAAPTTVYSHGNPTAEEQYILELINRARANPTQEGIMLASVTDPDILFAYNYFNVDKNKLKTDFAGYPVKPPMAFNTKLITAARGHSQDMSDHDFQGHDGSNGSQLGDRLTAVSYINWTAAGENVSAHSMSLFYAHVGFNVDWGVSSLGHRQNIMNFSSENFTEIGIGVVHDARPSPHTGPVIVTEDFGNANGPYIVGVVYKDLNGNNFYDVDEGLAGVTVMPSAGTYYATTSESGGYAIPITAKGNLTVTASGGGLPSPVTLNVTAGTENVKLDFLPGTPSLPGIVSLVSPAPAANITADSARLVWNKIGGATTYHVQVSTDSTFKSTFALNDSTLTDSSKVVRSLKGNTTYYWRARAKNDAGWGSFSTRNAFKVAAALPAQVMLVAPTDHAAAIAGNIMFLWRRGAADERKYQLFVSENVDMSSPIVADSTVQDTFKVVTGKLLADHEYYWQVRAKNGTGWGPVSAPYMLHVIALEGAVPQEEAQAAFSLTANTPNPFAGATRIHFAVAVPGHATVKVLNGAGEEVAMLADARFTEGAHDILWDATGMAAGVYYCQITMGNRVESLKMVLAR